MIPCAPANLYFSWLYPIVHSDRHGSVRMSDRYLTTEQRVSDWVRGQSDGRNPRHITKSLPARRSARSSDSSTLRMQSSPFFNNLIFNNKLDSLTQNHKLFHPLSPSSALLISSFPAACSLYRPLWFIAVTYAGSLEVPVGLTILPLIQSFFTYLLQDSRNESTAGHRQSSL